MIARPRIRTRRRAPGDSRHSIRILDLHLWEIGPGYRAAIVSIESDTQLNPRDVKDMLPEELGIAHATVEIHARGDWSETVGSRGE